MSNIEKYTKYISDQEYNNREQQRLNEMYPEPVVVKEEPQKQMEPETFTSRNSDYTYTSPSISPITTMIMCSSICGIL